MVNHYYKIMVYHYSKSWQTMSNYSFNKLQLCSIINGNNANMILTARELEVLTLIAKEFTSDEIAKTLHISVPTVETHRRNMFRKLGVQSVVGLLKEALRNGWIII